MSTRIGKAIISIVEQQNTSGEEIPKVFFLQKGGTVVAGHQFVIATVGTECIFMSADADVQSTLRIIVSTFLMRGVHTIQKRGKLQTPIHVCIFTSVENLNNEFSVDGIGLRSIKTRYAAVSKKCDVVARRDN
jgi:hypothetical protein